jgi:hypothetical protein
MGSEAVFKRCLRHVRYHPNRGAKADIPALRIWATSGLVHRNERHRYSVTFVGAARQREDQLDLDRLLNRKFCGLLTLRIRPV